MVSSTAASVVIADDDPMVHRAYQMMLAGQDEFHIVAFARDGEEAVRAYEEHHPAVMLMDLQMPVLSGVDAIRTICERHPGACVVASTTFGSRQHVVAALRAGASGYLLKDISADDLVASLRQACAGEMPLSSGVRRLLARSAVSDGASQEPAPDVGLTPRELELLGWLAQGLGNSDIAGKMYVSEGSVKQYLSHIGDKLGVRSRTQILIKALKLRLVDPASLA